MNISAPNRISYLRTSAYLSDGRPRNVLASIRDDDGETPTQIKRASILAWDKYKIKCETERESIGPSHAEYVTRMNIVAPPEPIYSGPLNRLKRMVTIYPYRDMNWLVAISFSFGSLAFILYGIFQLVTLLTIPPAGSGGMIGGDTIAGGMSNVSTGSGMSGGVGDPMGGGGIGDGIADPSQDMSGAIMGTVLSTIAVPAALITGSAVFFLVGFLGLLAAFNVDRGRDDGEKVLEEGTLDKIPSSTTYLPALLGSNEWVWFPSFLELRTIYLSNPAFVAGAFQVLGGMVYSIPAIAGFPGVIDFRNFENLPLLSSFIYLPQVIGASMFVLANLTLMILAQEKWWKLNLGDLTWHSAFWSTQGSVGFLTVGVLLLTNPADAFLTAFTGLFAACGFLIGALLQWYILMNFYVD